MNSEEYVQNLEFGKAQPSGIGNPKPKAKQHNDHRVKIAYRLGYYAKSKDDCPYSGLKLTCAFMAGFNDFEMGYKLDLSVF